MHPKNSENDQSILKIVNELLAAQMNGKYDDYSYVFKEFCDRENGLSVPDKIYLKQQFARYLEKTEKIRSNSQRQPDDSEYAYWLNAGEDDTTAFGMSNLNNQIPDYSTYQPEMTHSNNRETRPLLVCHTNVPEIPDTTACNQDTPEEIKIDVETPGPESKYEGPWIKKPKGCCKIIIPAMGLLGIFLIVIFPHYIFMTGSTPAGYDSTPNGSTLITYSNTSFEKKANSDEPVLAKTESIILTTLVDMEKIEITDPQMFETLPENTADFYLSIYPRKLYNWENLKVSNSTNVRAIEFRGNLNQRDVFLLLDQFKHTLTHISFLLDNYICDEFHSYYVTDHSFKLNVTNLKNIRFAGNINCPKVFAFVRNEVNLNTLKILVFEEAKILPNNVNIVHKLFELTQTTLEHLYMVGVSICSECQLFKDIKFSNLNSGKLAFKTDYHKNGSTLNRFNSNIPEGCRATRPDKQTLVVICELKDSSE